MLTLVIGGSGSGKSRFAEDLLSRHEAEKWYLACMVPYGEDARERIRRHREMRRDKGFFTVERYTDIAGIDPPDTACCLIECLGNLTANEIFEPDGCGPDAAADAIVSGILSLASRCRGVVAVTNDVGSAGHAYPPETLRYMQILGKINARIAAHADAVYELVCGIPLLIGKSPAEKLSAGGKRSPE